MTCDQINKLFDSFCSGLYCLRLSINGDPTAVMYRTLLSENQLKLSDLGGLGLQLYCRFTIAQQLALDFPEQVERLVLASTFASLRPRSWKNWAYLLRRSGTVLLKGSAAQAEQVANHLFPDHSQAVYRQMVIEKIRQANPLAYRKAMQSLMLFDSRRWVARIRVPVLVMTGAQDGTVPVAAQTELTKFLPDARQIIIPQVGHAINVDQPELFNQHLLGFLRPTVA